MNYWRRDIEQHFRTRQDVSQRAMSRDLRFGAACCWAVPSRSPSPCARLHVTSIGNVGLSPSDALSLPLLQSDATRRSIMRATAPYVMMAIAEPDDSGSGLQTVSTHRWYSYSVEG